MGPLNPANRQMIQQFCNECDSVIADLNHAYNVENLDTSTSNYSLGGFVVSAWSGNVNYNVADRVDALYQRLLGISQALNAQGIPTPYYQPFSGESIRKSEEAEHHILPNILGGNNYTTVASMRTAVQIDATRQVVTAARDQAFHFANTYGVVLPPPPQPMAVYHYNPVNHGDVQQKDPDSSCSSCCWIVAAVILGIGLASFKPNA